MKNPIVKKSAKQQELIAIVPVGAEMDAAARINHFHKVSMQAGVVAIKAALEVGMALFQEKIRRGGTFQAWVEQNCDFSRATAYRYLDLLQKSIGSQNDLVQLSDMSEKKREAAIAEFSSTVESKTLSELMCDYGIIQKSKSNLGGRREGAGRKRKDAAAELAAAADEIAAAAGAAELCKLIGDVFVRAVSQDEFGGVGTKELKEEIETLEQILSRAKAILKSRKDR